MECVVLMPIDKKRSLQLLKLLELFSKKAVIPVKEITQIIPMSTFHALLYKLKLLGNIVKERYGSELFTFELDRKQKTMKINAEMKIIDAEGSIFVEFKFITQS